MLSIPVLLFIGRIRVSKTEANAVVESRQPQVPLVHLALLFSNVDHKITSALRHLCGRKASLPIDASMGSSRQLASSHSRARARSNRLPSSVSVTAYTSMQHAGDQDSEIKTSKNA